MMKKILAAAALAALPALLAACSLLPVSTDDAVEACSASIDDLFAKMREELPDNPAQITYTHAEPVKIDGSWVIDYKITSSVIMFSLTMPFTCTYKDGVAILSNSKGVNV